MFIEMPIRTELYPLIPGFEKWAWITDLVIPGVEPNRYQISTFGRVINLSKYNHNPDKLMGISQKENGYIIGKFQLVDKSYVNKYIHRIELMTFDYVDGCEVLDVNHKDGDKTHNWLWNLEWATRSENIVHALNTGLMGYGEDASGSILSNDTVTKVCTMIDSGIRLSDISVITEVPYNLVYDIYRGNTWFIVSKDYNFLLDRAMKLFTYEQVIAIQSNTPIDDKILFLKLIGVDYDNLSEPKKRININLLQRIELEVLKQQGSTTIL